MANGYVSQVQLPNNETYDIKDKNAVKDITSSDIPGNINFTKGEEIKDVHVKDFGLAYGVDLYKDQLPIEVTSPGGNAIDYTIYGNDENGTENLCKLTIADCGINGNGTLTLSTAWQMICAPIVSGEKYTIVSDNIVYGFYTSKPEIGSTAYNSIRYAPGGTTRTFTSDITGWVAIRIESYRSNVVMLVEGSTAPDHYIPYQKGVGENTEITGDLPIEFRSNGDDLLGYKIYSTADGAGVQTENLANMKNSGMVRVTGTAFRYGVSWGKLADGNYTIFFKTTGIGGTNLFITTRTGTAYYQTPLGNTTSVHTFTVNNADDVMFRSAASEDTTWRALGVSNVMLVKGSTPPETFIPYGYKLPLTVKNSTETKTIDVYIGDSKLGEAEYIDYGEQKIYKRILFMTHDDKHFITKDNKDFCLRRRGYSG